MNFPCNVKPLIFTHLHTHTLTHTPTIGSMLCRRFSDPLDGPPFVAGCITLLRQFHTDKTEYFLEQMGQYVRSFVDSQIGAKYVKLFQNA